MTRDARLNDGEMSPRMSVGEDMVTELRLRMAVLVLLVTHLAVGTNARDLYLAESCQGVATPCFDTVAAVVADLAATPGAAVVHIGRGSFGSLTCGYSGAYSDVTFRGRGRDASSFAMLDVLGTTSCSGLAFEDLSIQNDVRWIGDGDSTWRGASVFGDRYAWNQLCFGGAGGHHDLSGVRVVSRVRAQSVSNAALKADCGTFTVAGSDLAALPDSGSPAAPGEILVILAAGDATVNVSDSTVRASAKSVPLSGDVVGIRAGGASSVSVTSGIVSIGAGGTANHSVDAIALVTDTSSNAVITTTGLAAFNLRAPFGVPKRVVGSGIASLYQWQAGKYPPLAETETNVLVGGLDRYFEVDCSSSGNCGGGGTEPHWMEYDSNCAEPGGGPWFDVSVGSCRKVQ